MARQSIACSVKTGSGLNQVISQRLCLAFNYSKIYSNKDPMNIHLTMVPIVSLIAGILILAMPKLLNYIIAIYLIAIGLFGLFGTRLH